MTLSSKTILVISDANSLKKLNNNELIKKFDTLLFYDNNHIEKFKLSRYKSTSGRNKKRILRIITAKALKDELNYFHKNTFEYFLSKNLPPNANKYTTLAVLLKNKSETEKLFFYVFNNSKKDIENDIPFFHKHAPDGYSYFSSKYEYTQLIAFLKKNKKNKKIKQIQQEKLELEPAPNKKHYMCQICKIRFENYLEHIHSKIHEQNKLNYTESFLRMKNTFQRIVDYNKKKKEQKENKENIENKEKIKITTYKKNNKLKENHKYVNTNRNENNTSNISENNNNNTTKCDSYFKENKDSKNVKMRTKSKTIINNVENNSKKEKKDEKDISPKGIEYIVSTIQIKHKFRAQKRKTNQIKKDLFTDNYNYDFQKVTGKISRAITNLKNC